MRIASILSLIVTLAGACPLARAAMPLAPTKATITYEANGGRGSMSRQSVKPFSTVTLKSNTFKRAGYIFTGWEDAYTGESYPNKARIVINGDMQLRAQWMYDEYTWLDKAHVSAGALTSESTTAYGTMILKTGKRNLRTGVSKFTATVVWPGTTKKITMKGESIDGTALLTGGGRVLYVAANEAGFDCEGDGCQGTGHISGKEGAPCLLSPGEYSLFSTISCCHSLPPITVTKTKWTVPRDATSLRLTYKKNTFEFSASYTDMCDGRKVTIKIFGVAYEGGGRGYAYGCNGVHPVELEPLWAW